MFQVITEEFNLGTDAVQDMARDMHRTVEKELAAADIAYATLRNALTPLPRRHEVAFVFDSNQAGGMYGRAISKLWLPALHKHGPKKTVIKHGDMIGIRPEIAWTALDKFLVCAKDFPRMSSEMYYIVYFTNLSAGQLQQMDKMLTASGGPYLGYVDCSTWNPLKLAMPLPQVGLRLENFIIAAEREGYTNQEGFPFEDYGFEILGIEESLYDALLSFRLDQGIPQWAAEDSSISLSLLSGKQAPFEGIKVSIEASRIEYLKKNHAEAFQKAGLQDLQPDAVAAAVKQKITHGLVFNLRFIEGSRDGVPDPELNAHMFTVQAEFSDASGKIRRCQIGMKYILATHIAEVVTFI